jgi:hypothetical protein
LYTLKKIAIYTSPHHFFKLMLIIIIIIIIIKADDTTIKKTSNKKGYHCGPYDRLIRAETRTHTDLRTLSLVQTTKQNTKAP